MSTMSPSQPATLARGRELTEPALRDAVDRLDPSTARVAAYHLGWCDENGDQISGSGGKAVRPVLALLAAEAVGAPPEVAVPGAVAVELVHNFSLLHDDLMDRDTQRRHRRTVWSIWGAATAILAGDALLALAHEILLESPSAGAGRAAWLLASATRELTRGQVADLAFETRDEVGLDECLDMAGAKTGSLLAASAAIGAVLADAPHSTVDALMAFGRHVGLAFQFVDDVLGIWGDPTVTGKPAHSDLAARKKSLPITHAMDRADLDPDLAGWLIGVGAPTQLSYPRVAELLDQAGVREWALGQAARRMRLAEGVLSEVDIKPQARIELIELARYVVERDS
ncbi:MAG TPA: polyprenyl synthetase family protein [Micromonosporaceae bacterium]|jgi:geranylgeranyl diphosphate synthase type I